MIIHRATSADNAIKINAKLGESYRTEEQIEAHINELFGRNNGDFFVIGSQTRKDFNGRLFKIVTVEDKDEDKHSVFFQLIYS
jgi:hypothetical protein